MLTYSFFDDQAIEHFFPDTPQLKLPKMVVNRLPGWVLAIQLTPLDPRPVDRQDRVKDSPQRMPSLALVVYNFFNKFPPLRRSDENRSTLGRLRS